MHNGRNYGRVACANECLRSHLSGEALSELLAIGAQKLLLHTPYHSAGRLSRDCLHPDKTLLPP